MSRRQKRRNRPGGGGFEKAQSSGLQADSRLVKLLETSLLLPGPCFEFIPGTTKAIVRDDQWMIALSIRDRCRELGGEPKTHLHRALEYMAQRGRE